MDGREDREHSTFPLEMVEYDAEGKERARMHVTKIERASVSDDAFDLPSDYAKVDPDFGTPPGGSGAPEHPAKGRPH